MGKRNKKTKGQSLVELAISLPLFMMLIAGIVEVGNLLVQRQRITTAVDMGVRFGSRGGSDDGVYVSAYNVLTQTMPISDESLWDAYVVRGQVNAQGTGWVDGGPQFEHVFGLGRTELYTQTQLYSDTLSNEILQGLQTRARVVDGEVVELLQNTVEGRTQSENEEIVGLILGHKAETILGIQTYFGQDVMISSQKYMTVHAIGEQTNGCDLYPLAISSAARNLPSQESPQGLSYYERTSNTFDPVVGTGGLEKYNYPANPPLWDEFRPRSGLRDVNEGVEGDVYVLNEGSTFRWAKWTNGSSAAADLAWPGTTDSYNYYSPEFGVDPTPGDGVHVGDRIKYDGGAGAWAALQDHIEVGRSIRVPIMGDESSDHFKVAGFIILKIIGYSNDGDGVGGSNFIVAEAVRTDTSCGQIVEQ